MKRILSFVLVLVCFVSVLVVPAFASSYVGSKPAESELLTKQQAVNLISDGTYSGQSMDYWACYYDFLTDKVCMVYATTPIYLSRIEGRPIISSEYVSGNHYACYYRLDADGWVFDKSGGIRNYAYISSSSDLQSLLSERRGIYYANCDVMYRTGDSSETFLFFRKPLSLQEAVMEGMESLTKDFGKVCLILSGVGLTILAALLGPGLIKRFLG